METVPLADLHLDPSNARRHGARNLTTIQASLTRFGQQKPIVIDPDGTVVAGNGTVEAARALGWTAIAVIRTTLEQAERLAYAIADNRSSELADWDEPALAALLQGLDASPAAWPTRPSPAGPSGREPGSRKRPAQVRS